jgi:GGDEF domain-containing protein
MGGKEFTIVCSGKSLDEITAMRERIRQAISEIETLSDQGAIIRCSISSGFAKVKKGSKMWMNF